MGSTSPSVMSRGEFGAAAIPRILDLLERYGACATWCIPGHSVYAYPDLVRRIRDAGHELGHHGWVHENPQKFDRDGERRNLERGFEAFDKVVGVRPRGYRSPAWDFSENTIDLLLEFGFDYDTSCMGNDVYPYYLRQGDKASPTEPYVFGEPVDLVEVPVTWGLDDFPPFEFVSGTNPGLTSPSDDDQPVRRPVEGRQPARPLEDRASRVCRAWDARSRLSRDAHGIPSPTNRTPGAPRNEVAVTADAEYVLEGLEGPAEILVDRWGVPHMYASSLYDVFRVQGFNAARDRLWQLDFWRRRGLGLLAEVFGPSMVERDRASRLFYYRGDMQPEWLSYGSDTKRVATAFVEGVNAYIRLALQDRDLLPLEFRQLGYEPALWAAEDFARIRSNGLYYNLDQEVARALTLRDYGQRVEDLRRPREPPVDLVVPEGLDLSVIPDDVQRVYRLAIDPPDLGQAREAVLQGSNNWVLAPERTTTSRPLLANDPHRALSVPSLRYLAHLSAPGLDVIGAGEPALPGISIGHNGRIAFGLTIFAIDQEDLYVYETNPDEPLEYRYQGRWEPMLAVHDTVKVKGGDDVEVELRYTRHGPIIYEDFERHTAFAVRAAWLEPGMAPYLGSMDYMRAANWDQFLAAMNRWGAPPENQLFADPSGHIGWKAAGLTPIRPNWDGTLPVPGDGRYEWAGFRDMDELPVATNPERGWLATANEMNLPDDYPAYDKVISFDWYASSRAERLAEVFEGDRRFSPEDCVRLQSDSVSLPARRIVRRLAQVKADDPTTTEALRLLTGWDGDLTPDSAPGALFEVWYRRHLRPALLRRTLAGLVPEDQVETVVTKLTPEDSLLADPRADLAIIEQPVDWLGEDAETVLDEILRSTLAAAVAEAEGLLGPDRERWAWGRLHVARLAHPLSPLLDEEIRARLAVGPVPRGGSGDTVGNTAYLADTFVQTSGATFRIVVDVGNWDGSLVMNSPGQSGDPDSPHYADLFEPWSRGEAFPLCYSRERVEAVTERRIRLRPALSPRRRRARGRRPGPGPGA